VIDFVPGSAAPRYVAAFAVDSGMSVMSIVFATILRTVLVRLNRKLDAEEESMAMGGLSSQEASERQQVAEEQGLPGAAVERGFRFLL
jgi:hypothetical protein